MPAPPARPPLKPPPNIMPIRPAPSMPPIRPDMKGLRAKKPPVCGAAGAAGAVFEAGCAGVVLRSTGLEVGAVWVGAGAWSVLLPRLPVLEPPPTRASATTGKAMIATAAMASKRLKRVLRID